MFLCMRLSPRLHVAPYGFTPYRSLIFSLAPCELARTGDLLCSLILPMYNAPSLTRMSTSRPDLYNRRPRFLIAYTIDGLAASLHLKPHLGVRFRRLPQASAGLEPGYLTELQLQSLLKPFINTHPSPQGVWKSISPPSTSSSTPTGKH
jgi:hypothetical protein